MKGNGDIYLRERIGEFFVGLTSRFYGGEITVHGNNGSDNGNPDVINWERNQAYESKANISSFHHKLHPQQIDRYEQLEKSTFPLENPEIYYFLWQYNRRGIAKVDRNEVEKELIRTTNGLLILSFDIVKELRNFLGTNYYNGGWGELCIFKSSQRKRFIQYPELSLEEIGLNKDDFLIKTEKILDKEYKYKRRYLPSFNIITIQNKNLKGVERK